MAKIDYKNRSVLLSYGYTTDGQKDVELYFDRFDKVLYFTDLNGSSFKADGTGYTPTSIPNENEIENIVIDMTPIENGDEYDSPNGRIYVNFKNKVIESSITVENFSINGQKVLNVWNSFDPAQSGFQLVIALNPGFIDTLEPNILYCNVENEAGDITKIGSQIGFRLNYRKFGNYDDLCSYATNGYPDFDLKNDGLVAYSQLSGGVFDIEFGKQIFNETPTLYYVRPYSYKTVIGGESTTVEGYYVQSDTAVSPSLLGQLVFDYCPSYVQFPATLNNGNTFESAEAVCEAYSNEGLNGTLYFEDDEHLYSDAGDTQLINGFIAYRVGETSDTVYVAQIIEGVQQTPTLLSEVCV